MSVPPIGPPPIDRAAVLPAVDDVALLLRTRTVGYAPGSGLGSDTGPSDHATFDATTRPTAAEVQSVIELAADEVLGQLPESVDVRLYPAIERAIATRAAVVIEQSFFRETSADLSAAYATSMTALQGAVPGSVAIASGLSDRELAVWAPWAPPVP